MTRMLKKFLNFFTKKPTPTTYDRTITHYLHMPNGKEIPLNAYQAKIVSEALKEITEKTREKRD